MAYLEEISELRHSVVEIESQIERAEADLVQCRDSQADGTKHDDEMTSLVDGLKAKREELTHQLNKARGA
jgi:chromosome segregation ATPase